MEQRTFLDILREKMAVPVNQRDTTGKVVGQVLPMEAMVTQVMSNAMKRGDLASINFIRLLTERGQQPDAEYEAQQRERIEGGSGSGSQGGGVSDGSGDVEG